MVRRNKLDAATENQTTSRALTGIAAIENAKEYLRQMTGRECEVVSGLHRTGQGWTVTLEVLELERIPPTTDVLGSYAIDLDGNGDLLSCERTRRYYRNQTDELGE